MIVTSIDITSGGAHPGHAGHDGHNGQDGHDGHVRTDAELVRDICAQKPGAVESLFNRYVRLVHAIAQRILNDRAEAEDITQEVFLEIYRKAHLYTASRGSFRIWLLQYVYHRTLRRQAMLRRRAAYRGEPIEIIDERPFDYRPHLTQDERRWVLRTALAQLPTHQRTTLELTCFEELPLREVAERLGVSVGCTRHYYYRGLARLRHWVHVTDRHSAHESRSVSRAGTTGAAKGPAPRRCARV